MVLAAIRSLRKPAARVNGRRVFFALESLRTALVRRQREFVRNAPLQLRHTDIGEVQFVGSGQ